MTHFVIPEAQAACAALLEMTWAVLERHGVGGVVVGGWAAKTFNTALPHPGTLDVDVLVPAGALDVEFPAAVETLTRDHGFLRSAKSAYQVARVFNVRGQDLLFHVDFLNERNADEIVFLDRGAGEVRSIYTPPMKAVFTAGPFREAKIGTQLVRFPSRAAFLATKIAALATRKRPRDPYDIFAAIVDETERQAVALEFAAQWHDQLFTSMTARLEAAFHEEPTEGDIDLTASTRAHELLRRMEVATFARHDIAAVVDDFVTRVRVGRGS